MSRSSPPDRLLDRECEVFTRYLVGGASTDRIRQAYSDGHAQIPYRRADGARPRARIDRITLSFARLGRIPARAADAYSRFFRPGGPLRQKLTLLLAILEHAPPFHTRLNAGGGGGPVLGLLGLAGIGVGFAFSLMFGVVVLGPVHLSSRNDEAAPGSGAAGAGLGGAG